MGPASTFNECRLLKKNLACNQCWLKSTRTGSVRTFKDHVLFNVLVWSELSLRREGEFELRRSSFPLIEQLSSEALKKTLHSLYAQSPTGLRSSVGARGDEAANAMLGAKFSSSRVPLECGACQTCSSTPPERAQTALGSTTTRAGRCPQEGDR